MNLVLLNAIGIKWIYSFDIIDSSGMLFCLLYLLAVIICLMYEKMSGIAS